MITCDEWCVHVMTTCDDYKWWVMATCDDYMWWLHVMSDGHMWWLHVMITCDEWLPHLMTTCDDYMQLPWPSGHGDYIQWLQMMTASSHVIITHYIWSSHVVTCITLHVACSVPIHLNGIVGESWHLQEQSESPSSALCSSLLSSLPRYTKDNDNNIQLIIIPIFCWWLYRCISFVIIPLL